MEYVAAIAYDQDIKDENGVVNPDVRAPALLKPLTLEIEVDDPDDEPPADGDEKGDDEEKEGSSDTDEAEQKKDSKRNSSENPKTRKKLKTKVIVPAAWTPANKRAQAALIYLYFRHVRHEFIYTYSHLILYDLFSDDGVVFASRPATGQTASNSGYVPYSIHDQQ